METHINVQFTTATWPCCPTHGVPLTQHMTNDWRSHQTIRWSCPVCPRAGD